MSGINCNEKVLAELVGGELPPLTRRIDQITARALTDSTSNTGSTPETRFSSARYWLERAYEDGREVRSQEERAEWKAKIARLFDL